MIVAPEGRAEDVLADANAVPLGAVRGEGIVKGGLRARIRHLVFKDFVPLFTCEKFNPDQWAELFKKSGARYVSRYDVDNFSQDLRAVNQEAGLSWACLIYRHTFGSQLAMKGESLYKIATLMGNSPEICRRHYAAISPEILELGVDFPPVMSPLSAPTPLTCTTPCPHLPDGACQTRRNTAS